MHIYARVIMLIALLGAANSCVKTPKEDFRQAQTMGVESFTVSRKLPKVKSEKVLQDLKLSKREEINLAVYNSELGTHVFRYHDINGMAVAEGNIILGDFEEVKSQQTAIQNVPPGVTFALVIPELGKIWPNGVVYYRFADDFGGEDAGEEARQAVREAIAEYEERTPIDFRYRTTQENYIEFVNQIPCCGFASMSQVGMQGGRQEIKIQTRDPEDYSQPRDPILIRRSALHEIGHALGFKHEISRPDRDDFVIIDFNCTDFWYNISGNYSIVEGFLTIGPYDYESVMHYPTGQSTKGPPWDQQPCLTVVKTEENREEGDDTGIISPNFFLSREDINALYHLYGKTTQSNEEGDRFGQRVLVYDFDRDGIDDVAVSAVRERIGNGPASGAVFLYKGTTEGFVYWKRIAPPQAQENQQFGWALAAGDFNNDRIQDLAVGAPGTEVNGKPAAGEVYIYSIFRNLSSEPIYRINKSDGIGATQIEKDDRFGQSLAAGRFYPSASMDLAIGVPGARVPGQGRPGAVFILNLRVVLNLHRIDTGNVELPNFGQFGFSMAALKEFNQSTYERDGLVVGSPSFSWLDCGESSVYVIKLEGNFMRVKQRILSPELPPIPDLCQSNGVVTPVLDYMPDILNQNYGFALASGDFDGDNDADFAVSAIIDFVHEGEPGGQVFVFTQDGTGSFNFTQEVTQTGLGLNEPNDLFGYSLASGDLDNDGNDDLIVGTPNEGLGSAQVISGALFVFHASGDSGTPFETWQSLTQTGAGANEAGDRFALSLGMGDVDGDGDIDVIAGTPDEAPGSEPKSGIFYWIIGRGTSDSNNLETHQGITQETKSPFQ